MKTLEKYRIDIYKLANKAHEYDFEINDEFFECFEFSEINEGSGKSHVILNKSDSLITLEFDIDVTVKLICDRSLDEFNFQVNLTDQMMYKYGEEEAELSDEVKVITQNTQSINLAQPLFELISVSVPVKKLHPRYKDDENEQDALFYQSDDGEKVDEEVVDPRWNALKNLKNNIK